MTDPTLFAAMPPAMADSLGKIVTDLLQGFVRVGELRFLIRLPITVTMSAFEAGVRFVPSGDVEVDRPGVNVFLEYVEIHRNGDVFASVRRFGVSLRRQL
jgi:hypothetical protein